MRVFLLCVLTLALASPVHAIQVSRCKKQAAGASCTVDNDGVLVEEWGASAGDTGSNYAASRFTFATEVEVTQYWAKFYDEGADTGNVRISIWSNSCSTCDRSDDEPDTEVTNTDISIAMSEVSSDSGNGEDMPLAATVTVSAGIYWWVNKIENGAARGQTRKTDAGGVRAYSTDGSSWTVATDSYIYEVLGCE